MSEPMAATEGVPDRFDRPALEAADYTGWRTWAELRASGLSDVPRLPGCYVVLRSSVSDVQFLAASEAGRFKEQDPTVSVERLTDEWTPGASVVYIGKANELRTRLKAYARFGAGEPVAHWGGRLIWQLADADELLVAWHVVAEKAGARHLERLLLERFADMHDGRRPLANLTG